MEIVVIGMGYMGIPLATLLANVEGFNVTGVQRRSKRSEWKIKYLNSGRSPIKSEEPELAELLKKVVLDGSFRVTNDISVCTDADIILIAVQTPVDEKYVPQYESLKEVSQSIGRFMKKGTLVAIESTVAPGTTKYVVKPILEESSGLNVGDDFNLVFSYERITVGRLIYNIRNMPKIVGGFTHACTKRGVAFYKNIVQAEIYTTDILTAEISKITENAYRDVNIAFANEIALVCESLGANVHKVREIVNSLPHDPSNQAKNPYRMMHIPGAGVGGHCLPKDTWLLKYSIETFGRKHVPLTLLTESRLINDYMPQHMMELIKDALKEQQLHLEEARICILGFAFLEDSDDTRNTPALTLYKLLVSNCEDVLIHDPYVDAQDGVMLTKDLRKAVKGRNCVAIVTRHREYLDIQLDWLKSNLTTPIIVDGRNVFKPEDAVDAGFTYRGVGIGTSTRLSWHSDLI